MKKVSAFLIHPARVTLLGRQWFPPLVLMAACLPAHAQQAVEQDPAKAVTPATSRRASVWLPNGASSAPDLSDGIGISAIEQHPDPGVQQWQVRRTDISVRRMLQRWGQEAGWQLVWDAPRDFPIETELQLSGRIEQVVSVVIESLATTDYPVQARINSELRIIRIGRYLEGKAR
ncbi:hypothetical protein HBH1_04480 [Herbaspirillum sp. BH-1]|uniref:Toxin co-regulated pilus biosynthesis protein Q C-terminal domain-containing protein n=1 Tax=Herbaspirillum frisingense TaxID=92645 RepID=A0ABU1PDR0_9BURK|nr:MULTISPECIES: TcpQ domain-containing protein [Herbaspirillum]MDR6584076.1 hypothetical protein [Herbaspirillum frisingense]PLY57272.1 hypothetical protein HBH1_04480 [Herbaspirillum sp. BH-1]